VEVSNFRYGIANGMRNAGLASEMEWLQSQVMNHADSTALAKQEAAFAKSKITLNQLLASALERDFYTEDSISSTLLPGLDVLIDEGISNNSSYTMAVRQVNLSRLEIKAIKAGYYPRISLTGSYGYFENKSEASFIRYNRNFGPHIGLNAGIAIFDGGRLRRDLENAHINNLNRELMVKEMEHELAALITQTYIDYQSHLKTTALCREGCNLALKNLAIATQALQAGLISPLQFREAQEELFEAESGLANAIYALRISETDLLRLSGALIR
jgi:outer membrane protein